MLGLYFALVFLFVAWFLIYSVSFFGYLRKNKQKTGAYASLILCVIGCALYIFMINK